jgi:Raf kinase inhibitor-like YbhB/YbcL family protein
MRGTTVGLLMLVLLSAAAGCAGDPGIYPAGDAEAVITVTSAAFADGGMIPTEYTCEGENLSPPLAFEGVPDGTVSLVLIVDDPDAPFGTYTHWILYAIPPGTRKLPAGIAVSGPLPGGGLQGKNAGGTFGYSGPCPPPGNSHRYFFRIYALDTVPTLPGTANRPAILAAMEGHVLATGELMGLYGRSSP